MEEKRILYVHGSVAEKTKEGPLKAQWDMALFGAPNRASSMAFWSNLKSPVTLTETDLFLIDMMIDASEDMKDFVKSYAADLFSYALQAEEREALNAVILRAMQAVKPAVIIAHGIGSFMAFEVLKANPEVNVDLFVTMGSPLGLPSIQNWLKMQHKDNPVVLPSGIKRWFNFSDRKDPLCRDTTLNDDFDDERITDCLVINANNKREVISTPQKAHNDIGYLRLKQLRAVVEDALK